MEDRMSRIEGFRTERRSWVGLLFLLIAAACTLTIYFLTAHRTIDWWFGSSYTLTAVTFGVHAPPGSFLLTLLGWLVAQLPLGLSRAFLLNIFAGIIGAGACCLVILLGLKLLRYRSNDGPFSGAGSSVMTLTGLLAGSLFLAFSETMWRYSVIFMPYILTALFTVLILWAAFEWWKRETGERRTGSSDRMLFLLMLLFGLDLSVHRTNLLMLPGFLLWVLLCRPRVYRRGRSWAAGAVGLLAGLAFQLLIMPLAALGPALNFGDPSSWRRFYEYISLQQYGGSWLVNMWPRKASFFGYQIGNYLAALKGNFLACGYVLAVDSLILFHVGMVALGRRDRKLLAGLLIMFLCASFGAVVYFNVPDGYIFAMDRHYIPSFVIFGLLLAVGAGSVLRFLWGWKSKYRMLALVPVLFVILYLPVKHVMWNYRKLDGSKNHFAYDFADNIMRTVQPGGIIIVQGDNYWAIYYMQSVEGMRPDVAILSESLLNTRWYVEQISNQYPDLPIGFTEKELAALASIPWQDTTVVTVVEGDTETYQLRKGRSEGVDDRGLAASAGGLAISDGSPGPMAALLPDSFALFMPPSVPDGVLLVQDRVILRMIEENRWRRPIYFTIPPARLRDHLRLEGLVWLLVPQAEAVLNVDLLRENLLDRYCYRGYSDPFVTIGSLYTRGTGRNLQVAFYYLASHEMEQGDENACRETIQKLKETVPLDRIEPQPSLREAIDGLCP